MCKHEHNGSHDLISEWERGGGEKKGRWGKAEGFFKYVLQKENFSWGKTQKNIYEIRQFLEYDWNKKTVWHHETLKA